MKISIRIPSNIRSELERWARIIRRADKHKLRQPLNKRMTPDVYAGFVQRQKSDG